RLGNAGPAGFPRHPSLERLLAWVPPSHMGLRTFVARILWAGERAFCRRQADREFAHAKLSPFVADVVHVRGAEALTLGTWCAAKWGARLVFEPSPAGPPPAKADLARVDCVVEEGQPEAELVRAYARLAPPARAAVSG
ncbi:MAG: hypothetical protein IMZ66_06565, partial [Planctomycetes bacterium]|nr:hypothetical protein [Planctomycetota bacterium]